MDNYNEWYKLAKKDIESTITKFEETEFAVEEHRRTIWCAIASAFAETTMPKIKDGKSKRVKEVIKASNKGVKNFIKQVKLIATERTPNTNQYSVKLAHNLTTAISQIAYLRTVTVGISPEYNYQMDLILNLVENAFDLEELSMEYQKMAKEWQERS